MSDTSKSDDALLMDAWAIIANAGGGDWSTQSADWQAAAKRWRDRFHATLPANVKLEDPSYRGACQG